MNLSEEWFNFLLDIRKTWNLVKEYATSREEYYRATSWVTYIIYIVLAMSVGRWAFAVMAVMEVFNFVVWCKYVRTGKLDAKREGIGEKR